MTVRQRTGNTQELPAAQMQRVSDFAALAQHSRLRRFCRRQQNRRRVAVRSHPGRAADQKPGAASAQSVRDPRPRPARSLSRAYTRRLLLRAALSRPLPGDFPAFSPPFFLEKISPCVCVEPCRRLPGLPGHEPEGGGTLFRQRSPSAVSFRVARSCIASCAAVDRLRRFHRQYAYSG